MQALLNIAATASIALALGGLVGGKPVAFDAVGGADTRVGAESQAGLAHETSLSLEQASTGGATIGDIESQAGDPELAAGIGAGAAAFGPGSVPDVSAAANDHDSGTEGAGAPAVASNAPLDADGSATLNLNAQYQEVDDAGISGGSKVGGAVKLAVRAR